MKPHIALRKGHFGIAASVILLMWSGPPLRGQSVALSLASGSAAPSGIVTLNLSSKSVSAQAGSFAWTLNYAAKDLTLVGVSDGPALTSVGKSTTCNLAAGTASCVASGVTASAIPDGVIAAVTFSPAPQPSSTSLAVAVSGPGAASLAGDAVAASATGGSISVIPVTPVVTAISCTPSSVVGPAPVTCSVSLNVPAPAGGLTADLNASSTALTFPATVLVPAGQATATFDANAAAVAANVTVNIVATASAAVSTSVVITPPPVSTPAVSLTCTSAVITASAPGTCTVSMSQPAANTLQLNLKSSLSQLIVPATIGIAGGLTRTQFTLYALPAAPNTAARVTASLGVSSTSANVTVGPSSGTFHTIRVNAGGGTIKDSSGLTWAADNSYLNGVPDSNAIPIHSTTTPALYTSERRSAWDDGTLHYSFVVPNGTYQVTLKFAELYFTAPGARVFDVFANGIKVLPAFDPFAVSGGQGIAVDRTFTVSVTSGTLALDFASLISHAQVCAIQIAK